VFNVLAMPEPVSPGLLEKLAMCETATIGHFRHTGFLDPALRAVLPGRRVAGTAVTVLAPGMDGTMMHWAVGHARPNDFLLVDRAGDARHACWGGVVTVAAKEAGVVGGAVDGFGTDFEEVRAQELPLWCRGPSPITTKLLGLEGGFNIPISCGGVIVHPGDAVLADESGLLVLRPWEIEETVAEALRRQAAETLRLKSLREGQKLHILSGAGSKVIPT
jgi:4-hydroxy-4-methyl-2-oxoglutarate aldolase